MRNKMPWIDRNKCDIEDRCTDCKAARLCKHEAFQIVPGGNGSGEAYKVMIDFEKCRLCGDCSHICELGAVKMV